MSQNIGTLLSAEIRPNDSNDPIATAFGNEIKGGHHGYASFAERNSLIFERRDWGMLVTVYNDGTSSNNNTYQLLYNNVDTNILNNANWVVFSGSGGGSTASGVIGPAESGTYSTGLFTDLNPNTLIGVPIDRFNQILKSLVPPSAPNLSDWSGSKAGSVNGKLSFDALNPVSGYNYISATNSPSPVSVDGSWNVSGKRIGIAASASSDITGILNYQVTINNGTPTPAYIAQSFGNASSGSLKMYLNGILKNAATLDLTNFSAQDTTVSGSLSGFNVSAATASKFPQGAPFEDFWNRTGTWRLKGNDPDIQLGYNYVYVTQDNSPGFVYTLAIYEFIVDNNVTSTSISGPTISSYLLTGNKSLSGIRYYTGGSIRYDVTIDNLYRNTYYSGSDAITFIDESGGLYAPLLNVGTILSLAPSLGSQSKQFKISNSDQNGSSLTFSVIGSGKRLLNSYLGIECTAKRTVQGNISGGLVGLNNIYLDNVSSSSTSYVENFDDESYRLVDTNGGLLYDLITDITSNPWNSSFSIIGATGGYTNALQVYNSKLVYPTINFSSVGTTSTNLNFSDSLTNYSIASGSRVYIRYFNQISPTTGNFVMTINGSGGTFVPLTTTLPGGNIHVEIKAPGSSSAQTGWLDAYNDFATGNWSDGNGARNASGGSGRAFGASWGLTIGTKNTANTGGYMLVRITVDSSFTGYFDSINWSFA